MTTSFICITILVEMLKTPTLKFPDGPGGMGLILGWKTKIPQSPVAQPKTKQNKKQKLKLKALA